MTPNYCCRVCRTATTEVGRTAAHLAAAERGDQFAHHAGVVTVVALVVAVVALVGVTAMEGQALAVLVALAVPVAWFAVTHIYRWFIRRIRFEEEL